MPHFRRRLLKFAALALAALWPALACAQQFTPEQIDQLTAQIALYPDALLSQVLMASTYPADVADAAKWAREHPDAKGDGAVQQVQGRDWDPSVTSLVAVPQVIITMGEKPDWVRNLGDAFLAQPEEVMDSVQRLRTKAQQSGNLTSNEQVNVKVETVAPDPEVTVVQQQAVPRQVIVIEQSQPEVIYVPTYNPTYVYGAWPYPAFPPVYVPPPPGYWWSAAIGGAVATGIAWGVSYAVGNAIWGGCNWGRRDININVNRYNNINVNRRLNINTRDARWSHDTRHRRDVPYRGGDATRQQLARKYDASKRDAYRGRAEATMRDRGVQVDRAAMRDRAQNINRDQVRDRAQNINRDQVRDRAQNINRDQVRDRAQNINRDQVRDRAQNINRDQVRDRAQNINRDQVRDRAQNVNRDKARDRAQNVNRDQARDRMQNVDRARAQNQLQKMNRDSALRDANSRQARQQIDRGNASRQAMQRDRAQRQRPQVQRQQQRPQAQRQQQRPQAGRGGGGARPQGQRGGGGRHR